jgi:hypothetical protein
VRGMGGKGKGTDFQTLQNPYPSEGSGGIALD